MAIVDRQSSERVGADVIKVEPPDGDQLGFKLTDSPAHLRTAAPLLGQHTELVLNASTSDKQAVNHKLVWLFIAGDPTPGTGSTAWQIDGLGFSEVFVAC